jgi:hypothetical protein
MLLITLEVESTVGVVPVGRSACGRRIARFRHNHKPDIEFLRAANRSPGEEMGDRPALVRGYGSHIKRLVLEAHQNFMVFTSFSGLDRLTMTLRRY